MNVEISDLTRRFGRHQAVAGVSLQAGPGVFGLLGPNGAGKTTLLRMMATVIPPSTGRLRLLGRAGLVLPALAERTVRDRLHEQSRPAPLAFQVVGVGLRVAVKPARLDEGPAILVKQFVELRVHPVQRRPR